MRLAHESLVPSGDNGQALMKGKRPLGLNINVAAQNVHPRVRGARAEKAREVGRAQARHSSGQDDVRAGGFDGDIPARSGHVPVELIVIFEEAQAIANAIVKRDISRSVLRGGDKDLQLEISGASLPFDAKGAAIGIPSADVGKEERIIKAAGSRIFHWNGAINSVPGAGEVDRKSTRLNSSHAN